MAGKNPKKPKPAASKGRANITTRSTSGIGFRFEDQVAAWLLLKMLAGEALPGIEVPGDRIQFQVAALGFEIEDLLISGPDPESGRRQLMISSKSNAQVTASGFKADFATAAWKEWDKASGPMRRDVDAFGLAKRGHTASFDTPWDDIKNWLSGEVTDLAISRARQTAKHRKIFDSLRRPAAANDRDAQIATAEMVRRVIVLSLDFQNSPSEYDALAIMRCRELLVSGLDTQARSLWERLQALSEAARVSHGTLELSTVWATLRTEFRLKDAPDHAASWRTLEAITSAYRDRINVTLPTGHQIDRATEQSALSARLASSPIAFVTGDSGSGKSALVKCHLDKEMPAARQVWLGPDDLAAAIREVDRVTFGLHRPLAETLAASASDTNVLVIDAAERIEPTLLNLVRQLIQSLAGSSLGQETIPWRIVVTCQPHAYDSIARAFAGSVAPEPVEVGGLSPAEVSRALDTAPAIKWLNNDKDVVALLRNLQTLSWVLSSKTTLSSSAVSSPSAVIDCVWAHWTQSKPTIQRMMMRLGEREADFVRRFPLSTLEDADIKAFEERPMALPLRMDDRNRIYFEHDLAADWARFQRLKEVADEVGEWAPLADNPLWINAIRMLGQFLLRMRSDDTVAWDVAYRALAIAQARNACDLLLDALCLDPNASAFLEERVAFLVQGQGENLARLLRRFHHIATLPTIDPGSLGLSPDVGIYIALQHRRPIIGLWLPIIDFLARHTDAISKLHSDEVAKICETWLTFLPVRASNGAGIKGRQELARLALEMVRSVQIEAGRRGVVGRGGSKALYVAALAAAPDLPSEISAWALELARRRETDEGVAEQISRLRAADAEEESAALALDPDAQAAAVAHQGRATPFLTNRRRSLPPWPHGPQGVVDRTFREAALKGQSLVPLMRIEPQAAAEVMLALLIEESPKEEHSFVGSRELGLENDWGHLGAYWNTPFFSFLSIAPAQALKAVIDLVNFCTDRWASGSRDDDAQSFTLQIANGEKRQFAGDRNVFSWSDQGSPFAGSLQSVLAALEKWLMDRVEVGDDITPTVETIFTEGRSAALIGVLTNIAKFKPDLLKGPLLPLAFSESSYEWDEMRVRQRFGFDGLSWANQSEFAFEAAKQWALAPHRKQEFINVISELVVLDVEFGSQVAEASRLWPKPETQRNIIYQQGIVARFDRGNYYSQTNKETGQISVYFQPPEDLLRAYQAYSVPMQPRLRQITLPYEIRKRLEDTTALSVEEAERFSAELKQALEERTRFRATHEDANGDEADEQERPDGLLIALAAILSARGAEWLVDHPDVDAVCADVLRASIANWGGSPGRHGLRFHFSEDDLHATSEGVMARWLAGQDGWDPAVLILLTSDVEKAVSTVMSRAGAERQRLGGVWWRLNEIGLLWSGLAPLNRYVHDDSSAGNRWERWRHRLRSLPISGQDRGPKNLIPDRIAQGLERLAKLQLEVAYNRDPAERQWLQNPKGAQLPRLDQQVLRSTFGWLLDVSTVDDDLRRDLALRFWSHERERFHPTDGDEVERSGRLDGYGYDLLARIAHIAATGSDEDAKVVIDSVLGLGARGSPAIERFLASWFAFAPSQGSARAFLGRWEGMIETITNPNWQGEGRRWYQVAALRRSVLGFNASGRLKAIAGYPEPLFELRRHYEAWARTHLSSGNDDLVAFTIFITSGAGTPLRLEGLGWIAEALKGSSRYSWDRDSLLERLAELVLATLNDNASELRVAEPHLTSLLAIVAALAAQNDPIAIVLQERLRQFGKPTK